MISLSTKTKEAIKVGIALVLGYYVALRFEFFSPTWVAISIAFVSLPTAGQSLQKGFLRMGGTLVAFVAGLFYLGLFPQDRWLFILSFTPFLFFVSYMVQGRNGKYFWFVAGFVTMMITTAGPGSPEHAFQFAAYRALETMMGIAIWTLVSVFVWPRTNLDTLRKTAHDLLGAHEHLMKRYRERVFDGNPGEDDAGALQKTRDEAGRMLAELGETINAAAAESYQVHEVHHLWRQLLKLSLRTVEILDRLQSGFSAIQKETLRKVLLHEEDLFDELEARLEDARRMLSGSAPGHSCHEVAIGVDMELLAPLDHFERAAVEVTKSELEELDRLVRGIVDCVRDIEGYERKLPAADTAVEEREVRLKGPLGLPPIDPDRVRGSVLVVVSMWVGFLVWIYVDPPGHVSWYQFLPNITLVLVQAPFIRPAFLKPFAFAFTVGLTAYVFVMPHLSGFWELAILLFSFSFAAAYFFKGIGRPAIFLAMFNMFGIQNEQSYDFASAANAFLFTMMALVVVVALSYITRSCRPEKAFVSMAGRFFGSCEFLLSRFGAERFGDRSLLERMKRAYHGQELRSLPAKMAQWGRQIDRVAYPDATPERLSTIVASLQVLVYRMEDLVEARGAPHAELLVRELTADIREWRLVIENGCRRWAKRPSDRDPAELRALLKSRMARLNQRVEETLNAAGPNEVSKAESANFYRLLGGFRGFSEAALVYADAAKEVDWEQWGEERFS